MTGEAGERDDDRSIRSRLRHLTTEDRIEFCLVVVLPVVAFWVLIFLAPASSRLDVGEQIGAGMLMTALYVPVMAMRFWD